MRKNKKGTSTLFLAIILSALILVETTYIAYVADLDRRLTYTRALKEQAEIYLASYNRQLFKTYGIYAFDHTTIDPYVFNQILAANGYEDGDTIYASGIYSIDTDALRRAVACYYSYRGSGVIFQRFASQIMALIEQIDEGGVIAELRSFVTSPASGLLGRIIAGGADISEAISGALELLGVDESSPEVQMFLYLMSSLGALNHESPDFGNDFTPSDFGFIFDFLELNSSFYDLGTDINENVLIHICLADYAANNFDCMLEDDTAIDGTAFNCFHQDNESDSEYILTGLEGFPAQALTDYYIFGTLFIKNLAYDLSDPQTREIVVPVADVLSAVISVLSAGTVILPPEVYELIIVIIMAEIESVQELVTVLNGGEITFLSIGDTDVLTLDYRGFLTVFMNLVPDDTLLTRMLVIINRDFPDYCIGINVETDYAGSTLTYEAVYELYQ